VRARAESARAVRAESALRGLAPACGFALLLALAASSDVRSPDDSASYQARAVHIRDGDSLIVSDGARQRDLRIAEVDSPERGQPWGKRATQALARLVMGKELRVELVEIDRYGREVSNVWADGVCVACELVRRGDAWAYRKYLRDPALLELERQAREARLGLWSQPAHAFIPPWEWRHGARTVGAEAAALSQFAPLAAVSPTASATASAPLACGAKRYCREMASCAEAQFHLEQCGLARLGRSYLPVTRGRITPGGQVCPLSHRQV
jgi:endonuclease YncB( thermonuclease family)